MGRLAVGENENPVAIVAHHAGSLLNFRGPWVRELCAAGHRVWCLAPDYTEAERRSVRQWGAIPVDYRLQRTGMNPWRDGRDLLALARLLKRLQPAALLSFSTKPVLYGTLAGWLARVPWRVALIEGVGYVFTEGGQPPGWRQRLLRFVVSRLYRLALFRAHRIIFLNEADRDEFVQRRWVPPARARVLGGIGVDLAIWKPAPPVLAPVTFLLVARLLREKGILEYVAAARQVRAQAPSARFVLLGGLDSNPGALTRDAVQAWVDEGLLVWPGHVAVQPWLARASVFVLPSYREGVPRSTQEALAMARPVITTDAPGCRETIRDGVNGYCVPVRDVEALAQAMLRFVRDPEKIARMGAASRQLAETRFDMRAANARLSAWLLDDGSVNT